MTMWWISVLPPILHPLGHITLPLPAWPSPATNAAHLPSCPTGIAGLQQSDLPAFPCASLRGQSDSVSYLILWQMNCILGQRRIKDVKLDGYLISFRMGGAHANRAGGPITRHGALAHCTACSSRLIFPAARRSICHSETNTMS